MPTASELRELEDDELESRLSEYRREMLNLRFQLATGQLDNIVRLSVVRKDVARVLTVLRDREIALAEGRDAGPVLSTRPKRRRVEDVEEFEEEVVARPPRASRAKAAKEVDEVVDDAVDEDEPVLDDGADGDEEEDE